MQNLGIKLMAVSYSCIGGLLGQFIRCALPGHPPDWLQDRMDLLAFALLGNFLGLTCLLLIFRRRAVEPPLDSIVTPVEVLLRGLPANNRVAFLLFSAAWLVGLLLGMGLTVQ